MQNENKYCTDKCMDCHKSDTCQEPKDSEYVEWRLFRTGEKEETK